MINVTEKLASGRERGHIRWRGNSFQVLTDAGVDSLRELRLAASTTDEAEAKQILNRFWAQVDAQQNARTKATLGAAIDAWLRVHDVEENTRQGYEIYARRYIKPALGHVLVGKVTARLLEEFYAELRRCRLRCDGRPATDHRTDEPHECRVVGTSGHLIARQLVGIRRTTVPSMGCTVIECPPHGCKPLSAATIRHVHFAIGAALSAAVRWDWIKANSASVAKKPRQPAPQPNPPTVEQADRIAAAAWEQDESWGTLVWLVMVTGMRRAELLALRWSDVDLRAGKLNIRRNYVRVNGRTIEKDTKTHQMRRISLDPATVEGLAEHRQRYEAIARQISIEPTDRAFLFSHEPAHDRPYDPSATTLRVYAAWVGESDRRAAEILGGRLQRPARSVRKLPAMRMLKSVPVDRHECGKPLE